MPVGNIASGAAYVPAQVCECDKQLTGLDWRRHVHIEAVEQRARPVLVRSECGKGDRRNACLILER